MASGRSGAASPGVAVLLHHEAITLPAGPVAAGAGTARLLSSQVALPAGPWHWQQQVTNPALGLAVAAAGMEMEQCKLQHARWYLYNIVLL